MVLNQRLALLDILTQVELDNTESDLVSQVELLNDFELEGAFGEMILLVYADADVLDCLAEVVVDAVVDDGTFCCAAAVFGVDGVGEVPFDVG